MKTVRCRIAVASILAAALLPFSGCRHAEIPSTSSHAPGEKSSTVVVAGTGKDIYTVYDASGKSLGSRSTNVPIELMPGNYAAELNGTRQSLTVAAGQPASVTAGSAVAAGTGKDIYTVYDTSGKSLGSRSTSVPIELLPGNYAVELNGTRQSMTVRAGQPGSVTAGSVTVAGTGANIYSAYDASGRSLASRSTNVSLELFPGNYVVQGDGVKKPVTIRPGQQVVVPSK